MGTMISLVIGLILYLFSRIIVVNSLLGFIYKFLGLYFCQKKMCFILRKIDINPTRK